MVDWTEHLFPNAADVQPHEPPEDYRPGGFHPVTLGDTFQDGRFVIRHKLGFGGQATVWLAQDIRQSQWVSLKIKQSRISQGPLGQDPEVQALAALEKHYASSDQKLSRCFTRLLATFQITGPNGTHNCLVTELVGPSVARVLRACSLFGETLRPDTVLRASRRILQAVNFSHQAGVVHGDISFGNIAFTCDVALNGEEDIFVALGGKPLTASYAGERPLPPHMPRMLVKTADWDMWTDRDEEDIRLLDWGLAFPVGQAVTTLPQPIDLRSPETFFCASIDFRHDLWRAGCVVSSSSYSWTNSGLFLSSTYYPQLNRSAQIYASFFQQSPFPFEHGSDAAFVGKMVSRLGPLPAEWHLLWREMQRTSADYPLSHETNGYHQIQEETYEERRNIIMRKCQEGDYQADEYSDYDFESLRVLSRTISTLLRWEPVSRATAQEALSSIDWVDHRNGTQQVCPNLTIL